MINPTILSFFGISLLMALMPGPDNIFLVTQSTIQGRRAGLCLTAGLCTGLMFHTVAVALGLAAVIKVYPIIFNVIKLGGASYLLYLAWLSYKSSVNVQRPEGEGAPLNVQKLFFRGILMNVTNPKVSIFFLAFLPQFVAPSQVSVEWQLLFLGFVLMLASLLVFSCLSLISGALGENILRSKTTFNIINKVGAGVFVMLAIKIVL